MQDARSMGWARANHLPAEMLDSVHGLNKRFLDLAAVGEGGPSPGVWRSEARLGLTADVSAQLLPLSAAQKAAAADCPYALFDLRFRDDAHWRTRLGDEGRWNVAEDEPVPVPRETFAFVSLAIFFAWHVATAGRLASEWLLGMTDGTVAAFRAATIDSLPALAATEAVHLTARWSTCPAYWGALAGAAARPNPAGLRKVQLYGLQLVAAARLT